MTDTRSQIFEILKDQFAVDYIDGSENLVNTLGADSLDRVELSIELECAFNIEFHNDELDYVDTVEALCQAVQKKVDEVGKRQ